MKNPIVHHLPIDTYPVEYRIGPGVVP